MPYKMTKELFEAIDHDVKEARDVAEALGHDTVGG